MRRIPRLRRPDGLATCAASCQSATARVAYPAARAAANNPTRPAATTRTMPSRSAAAYLPRFYSTNKKDPIPQSLADASTPVPGRTPDSIEGPDGATVTAQQPQQEPASYVQDYAQEAMEEEAESDEALFPLYRPPPRRTLALAADEVLDGTYVPATTMDGLRTVGGVAHWWEARDHWRGDFAGFRPRRKATDPAVLEAAARRAVAEAWALRQAGREAELAAAWPLGPPRCALQQVGVAAAEEGGRVVLTGDVAALLDSLTWKEGGPTAADEGAEPAPAAPAADPAEAAKISPAKAAEYSQGWDKSWKNVPLEDMRIKFAVVKRIFQLTGQRVPDYQLPEIGSAHTLLRVLQKPPKPRTLTQDITERRPELLQLPNVAFSAKRVTRGDREKAVGRFKLIEEEFRKRELPLEGHGGAGKNKERDWFRGEA